MIREHLNSKQLRKPIIVFTSTRNDAEELYRQIKQTLKSIPKIALVADEQDLSEFASSVARQSVIVTSDEVNNCWHDWKVPVVPLLINFHLPSDYNTLVKRLSLMRRGFGTESYFK